MQGKSASFSQLDNFTDEEEYIPEANDDSDDQDFDISGIVVI